MLAPMGLRLSEHKTLTAHIAVPNLLQNPGPTSLILRLQL